MIICAAAPTTNMSHEISHLREAKLPIKYTITMASHMMEVTPPSTVERSFILLSGSSPALLYYMIFEAVFTATVSAAPTTKMSHVTVQPP